MSGEDGRPGLMAGADKVPVSPSSTLSLRDAVGRFGNDLPLPGQGGTLQRWRVLADVAAQDLSLIKLFEGHADAVAILAELNGPRPTSGDLWGTWCAEPPSARLLFATAAAGPDVRLTGTKAWCSGAAQVTHAVVSGWNAAGEPCLAAVALNHPTVQVTDRGWLAVGMADTRSVDVRFEQTPAVQLGGPHAYVHRPGFWHGGAGIAACWWGGAAGIGRMTRRFVGARDDPHAKAHLGAIDAALSASAAALREAAGWIDANRDGDARRCAMRVRAIVEDAANRVLHHAGRATGAGPLCRDARFARAMADLPVYLRQSHAERDLAALGGLLGVDGEALWPL